MLLKNFLYCYLYRKLESTKVLDGSAVSMVAISILYLYAQNWHPRNLEVFHYFKKEFPITPKTCYRPKCTKNRIHSRRVEIFLCWVSQYVPRIWHSAST